MSETTQKPLTAMGVKEMLRSMYGRREQKDHGRRL